MEAEGMTELRRGLLAGLSGTVVDVGAGNGLNFAHYPAAVTEVIAVGARALPPRPGYPGRTACAGARDSAAR